jgi:hypothetical protein
MNAANPDAVNLLGALILLALVVLGAWLLMRNAHTKRLEERFGAEYHRAVARLGSRAKAEAELKARETRVRSLNIVPLPPADAARFTQEWKAVQARFVDDPKAALVEADRLVRELMQARGYPMTDFERCAADLSVDHASVVENFRAAAAIVEADRRGQADTEALRRALVHYRELFQELLEVEQRPLQAPPARMKEVRP